MYPNNADRHILQMGTVIWGGGYQRFVIGSRKRLIESRCGA